MYLYNRGADPNSLNSKLMTPIAYGNKGMLKKFGLLRATSTVPNRFVRFDNKHLFERIVEKEDRVTRKETKDTPKTKFKTMKTTRRTEITEKSERSLQEFHIRSPRR